MFLCCTSPFYLSGVTTAELLWQIWMWYNTSIRHNSKDISHISINDRALLTPTLEVRLGYPGIQMMTLNSNCNGNSLHYIFIIMSRPSDTLRSETCTRLMPDCKSQHQKMRIWARNLIIKMGPGMFYINSPATKLLCHAILFYIELTFCITGKTKFLSSTRNSVRILLLFTLSMAGLPR